MPDLREQLAHALVEAARGTIRPPFKNRETAAAYLEVLNTVLNDIEATYPHGCAEEVLTRIQAIANNPSVSVAELAACQTLDQLRELLNPAESVD